MLTFWFVKYGDIIFFVKLFLELYFFENVKDHKKNFLSSEFVKKDFSQDVK